MEKNSEPVYLYLRDNKYYATPSIDLAIKRAEVDKILVLNNTPEPEE